MKPLTFDDMHNMVAFLSKSDESAGFDQIGYFLNAHAIQRIHPNKGEIEAIDADEDITLVDVETQEEVTITMAQTLIKLKAEKTKLLDEQIAQKLHDEEVQKAAARDKKEKVDLERAQVLQKQYDDKEENIDWESQARKNMIIYLKNMVGYKMEHFRGMTYDKIRPIFEMEYKKVQTLFKPDKDVEEPKKKRVAKETLPQESFKKLKAVKVTGYESTQEIPSNDLKEMSEEDVQNMLEIVIVFEFKVEALQVRYPIIDWEIHTEVPSVDKEKALWVELKRLFEVDVDDVLWKLQRHDMFMLIEKDYPLSNGVMILMLSGKLQVEEDNEMARDLVMKIFMEANKPKSRRINVAGSSITAAGSRLVLLGKVDTVAEAEPVVETSRLLMCEATAVDIEYLNRQKLLDLLRYMKPPMDVYAPVTVEVGVELYRKEQRIAEIEQKAKTPLDLEIVNLFITPFVFGAR
nr:arginine--tRNA ligase, chloroplastic/mitochondrial [Tanacetum cinerariifolium]